MDKYDDVADTLHCCGGQACIDKIAQALRQAAAEAYEDAAKYHADQTKCGDFMLAKAAALKGESKEVG